MRFLNGKSLVVIGFILVLLIGIPSTIFLVQQQQDVRSRAEKTSNLTATATKTAIAVDEEIPVVITLDPGKNFVTYVNVEVLYDKSKLKIAKDNPYTPNSAAFPIPVRGPSYTDGKVVFSLQSAATDVTRTIKTKTEVATLRFVAIAPTDPGTPAFVTFGSGSQAYSAGGSANGGANDRFDENVLTGQFVPVNITITGTASVTPSPTISETPSITPTPTGGTSNGTTITPSPTPTTAPLADVANPTSTPAANQVPSCLSLNIDRATTGVAPYDVALTATGNDTDGNIAKVTFQYGDGPVDNIANGGGIGTNSISLQTTHTYHNPGTYQAYVLLTDDKGGVSAVGSCTQTITVTGSSTGTTQGSGSSTSTTTTTTTGGTTTGTSAALPQAGANDVLLGLGAIGGGISLIGLILFFAL